MSRLFGAALLLVPFLSVDAHAAALIVDCTSGPFLTIQDAVDAAANGDSIVVHPCTPNYNENVLVSGFIDLHLVAAEAPGLVGSYTTGVGTLPNPPVIVDGTSLPGDCITVDTSTDVSIVGFRLQNCEVGVTVTNSEDTVIHGNRIQNQARAGILDVLSQTTTASGNVVGLNDVGIQVSVGSRGLRILDNRVAFNNFQGIHVITDACQISNNDVRNNTIAGIHVESGFDNRVERNDSLLNTGDNVLIDTGATNTDAIGNETGGSIVDLGTGSDLAENT